MNASNRYRALIAACALLATAAAHAHPGHASDGLAAGLAHPFQGLDHLLAMVAVGLWSSTALPGRARLAGPALFMAALLSGSVLALCGVALPGVEAGVALSVTALAALLLGGRHITPQAGLLLVTVSGVWHGFAHAGELVAGQSFAGYAAGFLIGSALLHGTGLLLAPRLHALSMHAWRATAALIGSGGLLMLATRM